MLQPPTSSPLPPSSRALHLPRSVPQPHPSPSSLLVTAPVGQQHDTAAISPSLAATSSSPAELLPRELSLLFSGQPSPPAAEPNTRTPLWLLLSMQHHLHSSRPADPTADPNQRPLPSLLQPGRQHQQQQQPSHHLQRLLSL